MKRFHKIVLLIALLIATIILVTTAFAQAGSLSMSWFTIDAGGGTSMSADSVYLLKSTIGQPDTQRMTAESIQLFGGFWGSDPHNRPPTEAGDPKLFLPIILESFLID